MQTVFMSAGCNGSVMLIIGGERKKGIFCFSLYTALHAVGNTSFIHLVYYSSGGQPRTNGPRILVRGSLSKELGPGQVHNCFFSHRQIVQGANQKESKSINDECNPPSDVLVPFQCECGAARNYAVLDYGCYEQEDCSAFSWIPHAWMNFSRMILWVTHQGHWHVCKNMPVFLSILVSWISNGLRRWVVSCLSVCLSVGLEHGADAQAGRWVECWYLSTDLTEDG
ncbi:hypothetical protein F5B21DRAFT_130825 [Xylaria acuta]|nr:hypothetical protein F5B21DRAFT_130825 [Xylaria acuta]